MRDLDGEGEMGLSAKWCHHRTLSVRGLHIKILIWMVNDSSEFSIEWFDMTLIL